MVKNIRIINFKKHLSKNINLDKKVTLLFGPNGSGKTSILESISLFTVGKGIFNVNNDESITLGKNYFIVELICQDINFSMKYQNKNKEIFINKAQKTPSNLLEHISVLGLTPYSSLAFWQDTSARRRIIDRVIMQHDPLYSKYYSMYNKALKQRNLLIKNKTFNAKWGEILDSCIQSNGLKINEIRSKVIEKIIKNQNSEVTDFLRNRIKIDILPSIEEQENILKQGKIPEYNFIGPHLSKFSLSIENGIGLSTGEQRKLLISFLLIGLKLNESKENILLLDDVLINLDKETIKNLLDILSKQNFQTILTNVSSITHKNLSTISIR